MKKQPFSMASGSWLDKIFQKLRIRKIIKFIRPGVILCDAGCGNEGVLLHSLRDRIGKGYGVDIIVNDDFSDEKISLIESDLNEKIPLPDNSVDIVTSLASLEHLEKPQQALSEIYRILKPDGLLLITVPSVFAKPVLEFLAIRLQLINKFSILDHKRYYSKQTISKACSEQGFCEIDHQYFQFYMNNFVSAKKCVGSRNI